ncbi:rod shape-determining protein MreC [Pseudobacteriovorax antillogorgiicola]|nr:rod shape-determining protein MreC [Pseudobacteriovorax antillogorgiicola]
MQPWSTTSSLGMLLQEVAYPFEYAWNTTTGFVSSTWRHYIALSETAKENTDLRSEINGLKTKILDYDEKVQEISRLRKLLGFVQHYDQRHLVAEVIGSSKDSAFRSLRINKGEWDGARVGMPIVTADGVVGRIIRTGQKFSDVHLLSDSNFNIDILLQRTRVRGVLQGYGSHAILTLNRRAEIRIGDTVITSGIVGGFPKGLPVGRVVKISYESDHISQSIKVEPWVDFERVEEVIVLETHDPEIQKIIESAGKDWFKRQTGNGEG